VCPAIRLAPLCDLAAEAGIERSTAWRWLKNGDLGEPVKFPGDRRVHVDRAAFLRALQAPTGTAANAEEIAPRAEQPPVGAQRGYQIR